MAKCPLAVIHPGPSDVEARVSYPLAAFATHKRGAGKEILGFLELK